MAAVDELYTLLGLWRRPAAHIIASNPPQEIKLPARPRKRERRSEIKRPKHRKSYGVDLPVLKLFGPFPLCMTFTRNPSDDVSKVQRSMKSSSR
ncbi:hypothetical protein J6590_007099 [Homalodisca vitripennis]|nr:hypothetical protein J6590_007099 [Homalodisca vitripennis]